MRLRSLVAAALVSLVAASSTRDASACAGSFRPVPEISTGAVTDHRIVFKIGKTETILWDQMRYAGSPSEFAWVLPVREGARVELSHDEWIAALEATTASSTTQAPSTCTKEDESSGCAGDGTTTFGSRGGDGTPGVIVVNQQVVGPYDVVTLRAKNGEGISAWLTTNGFGIPDASKTIIDQYTSEGFDFVALRLRPGQGTQAMQPVRVVMPGSDPTLPLRMIAAGAGPKVGILLWVVAEGRYQAQNFPNALVDDAKLFIQGDGTSNLPDLQAAAVADGRTWLTEFSGAPTTDLEARYKDTCSRLPLTSGPCQDAGATEDAGSDGGGPTPAPCVEQHGGCTDFDDAVVAARELDATNLWVTRMRANLPLSSLAVDLRFEAAEQKPISSAHVIPFRGDCDDRGCRTTGRAPIGTWTLAALTALVVGSIARRRRR